MNFSLRQKIFLGYIVMISFTLLVGMYAIFSLKELNAITRTIVYNSVAINEKLTRLNDSILAQDLYEKRSLLLQQLMQRTCSGPGAGSSGTFWARSARQRRTSAPTSTALISLHEKYNTLFTREIQLIKDHKNQEAEEMSGP